MCYHGVSGERAGEPISNPRGGVRAEKENKKP